MLLVAKRFAGAMRIQVFLCVSGLEILLSLVLQVKHATSRVVLRIVKSVVGPRIVRRPALTQKPKLAVHHVIKRQLKKIARPVLRHVVPRHVVHPALFPIRNLILSHAMQHVQRRVQIHTPKQVTRIAVRHVLRLVRYLAPIMTVKTAVHHALRRVQFPVLKPMMIQTVNLAKHLPA